MSSQQEIDQLNRDADALAAQYGTTFWAAKNRKDDPYFKRKNPNTIYEDGVILKQPYYKQIAAKRGMPLRDGKNQKTGANYDRRLRFGDGGEELMRIVAGLQRGVRQINGTQTVDAANDWLQRNGKDNWEVIEGDFTGPQGRPDGIPEVVVTDAKGNVRIVNGYALGPTSYGWRRAYYSTVPEEDRGGFTYGQFKSEYKRIGRGLDAEKEFYYKNDLDGKLSKIRGKISARNMFRQVFFTPTFKQFKDIFDKNMLGMDRSQVSAHIFKYVWNLLFLYPAIVQKNGGISPETLLDQDPKKFEQLKKSNAVKEAIKDRMKEIVGDKGQQVMLFVKVASLICIVLTHVFDISLDPNATVYNIKVSTLLDYGAVEQYCTTESNEDLMESQIAAMETDDDEYYRQIREAQASKYNTRQAQIDYSKALLQNTPMYYEDVRNGAIAAGWRDLYGLHNEDENVWAPVLDAYGKQDRPQIPKDAPAARTQAKPPFKSAFGKTGGLKFGNTTFVKAKEQEKENTTGFGAKPAGNGTKTTGFGTKSTGKFSFGGSTLGSNQQKQANAEAVAKQHGMPTVSQKVVKDADKTSPQKRKAHVLGVENDEPNE